MKKKLFGVLVSMAIIAFTTFGCGSGGSGGGGGDSNQDIVDAQTPVITGQPQGGTYTAGSTVILTVHATVTSGTLSYQWYSNTVNSNSGGTPVGINSASYTLDTSALGTTYYYVVVTNTIPDNGDGGNKTSSVTSNAASVTINNLVNALAPNITVQPAGATYARNQAATALAVTANSTDGGTLSYQWYSNTINSNSGGTSLGSGARTANYTPSTTSVGTVWYYVVVANTITNNDDGGNKTATTTSNTAAVVVTQINAAAPNITGQPQGGTYIINSTVTLTVVASVNDGGALSYQWYKNTTGSTSGGTTVGTDSSYNPDTATFGTIYYYVVVTNTIINNGDGGNKTATTTSAIATVTVSTLANAVEPTITLQPADMAYVQGESFYPALTVAAYASDGGTLSYQWYSNTVNSNSGGTSLGTVNGGQTASLMPNITSIGTLYYYVVVTNTNNSVNGAKTAVVTSNPAVVTVNSESLFFNVTNTAEWTAACNRIKNLFVSGKTIKININVIDDFSVDGSTYVNSTFANTANIIVNINGPSTLTLSGVGNLLYISANQTVVINNLELIGHPDNNSSLVYIGGSLTMNGGSISSNTVNSTSNNGPSGGVYVASGGSFTMNGNASISGNSSNISGLGGGGVCVYGGSFTMNDNASISGNSASASRGYGGGVFVQGGSFTMNDSASISDNSVSATTTYDAYGGGVCVVNGSFTMNNGSISGNRATGGSSLSAYGRGGGVYIGSGSFIMNNGSISGNRATSVANSLGITTGYGGGVCVGGGSFRITNGIVYGNDVVPTGLRNIASSDGRALYVSGGTAQYGWLVGENWTPIGDLASTDNTIYIVNGTIYAAVTSISGVPTTATAGTPLTLTSSVNPGNATYKTISWTIQNAGGTGASISGGNTLNTTSAGAVTVRATIVNGTGVGTNYTQDFVINVYQSTTFTINFEQIADQAPSITGPTISRSGTGGYQITATIAVSNPGEYSSFYWYIDEAVTPASTSSSIMLDATNNTYNGVGIHYITLEVVKGGIYYNKTVTFTVTY